METIYILPTGSHWSIKKENDVRSLHRYWQMEQALKKARQYMDNGYRAVFILRDGTKKELI